MKTPRIMRLPIYATALLAKALLLPGLAAGGPPETLVHLPNPYAGAGPVAEHRGGFGQPTGGAGKTTSNGISYHNGPVMTAPVNIVYIWYGTWTLAQKYILTDFASALGGSPYWNINSTYYQGSAQKQYVSTSVQLTAQVDDNYSQGKLNLSDSAIQAIVSKAVSTLGVADPNAIYFVLTSADVTKSGFCTSYCGWHTHATLANQDIKYSFVGNPAQCMSSCAAQTTGPNGDAGVDAMVSIIAHEAEEAATDPDLNAWYDVRGYENADKCAWTFGTMYTAVNGAKANVLLGSRDYLIQRNWVNAGGGYCAMSY